MFFKLLSLYLILSSLVITISDSYVDDFNLNSPVRICIITSNMALNSGDGLENEDKTTEMPKFKQGIGEKIRPYIEYLWHRLPPINRTIVTDVEFGDVMEDGNYTGCLGKMQRNESDVSLGCFRFPIVDDDNLIQLNPFAYTRIGITSGYNMTDTTKNSDILMDTTKALTFLAVVCITTTVAFYVLMLKVFSKFRFRHELTLHQEENSVFEIFAHFIQEEFTDFKDSATRILVLSLTVFSFYILNYISNYISTELVAPIRPVAVETFQDILDRPDYRPYVPIIMGTHREFEHMDPKSPGGKVWKRFLSLCEDTFVCDVVRYPYKKNPNAPPKKKLENLEMLSIVSNDVFFGRGAFLEYDPPVEIGLRTMIRLNFALHPEYYKEMPLVRGLITHDPSAQYHVRGSVIRRGYERHPFGQTWVKRNQRFYEVGMAIFMEKYVNDGFLHELIPKGQVDIADKIVHRKVEVKQVPYDPTVGIVHLWAAFVFFLIAMAFALYISIFENAHYYLFGQYRRVRKAVPIEDTVPLDNGLESSREVTVSNDKEPVRIELKSDSSHHSEGRKELLIQVEIH